ncbi:MAG TPA: hypothetical protein VIT88_02980 [Pyrinomonadaceae bacterium]
MKKQNSIFGVLGIFAGLTVLCLSGYAQEKRQVNVIVDAKPLTSKLKVNEPFMFRVSIYNGLKKEILFPTFALTPNGWRGESANLTFYDVIQKSGQQAQIYWRREPINVPSTISGMASYRIKPKEKLYIVVDAKKDYATTKWFAGEYEFTVRADNISVDRSTTISVASEPVKFIVE